MPSLVVLGAVLMVAGGVLVLLQHKHTPRLRLSNTISVAGVGELDPLFTPSGRSTPPAAASTTRSTP